MSVFPDGRSETFSYQKCLDQWMATKTQKTPRSTSNGEVCRVFRNEILDQMRDVRFKARLGGQGNEFHVGHDWQKGNAFIKILKDFCAKRKIDICSIRICWRKQKAYHQYNSPYLVDIDLAKEWKCWHLMRSKGMRMEPAYQNMTSPQ